MSSPVGDFGRPSLLKSFHREFVYAIITRSFSLIISSSSLKYMSIPRTGFEISNFHKFTTYEVIFRDAKTIFKLQPSLVN